MSALRYLGLVIALLTAFSATRASAYLHPGVEEGDPVRFVLGLKGTYPHGIALSGTCRVSRHLYVQIEPGIDAGKLNIGWGEITDSLFLPGGSLLSFSVLRTWSDRVAMREQTYLGLNVQYLCEPLGLEYGFYRIVDGDHAEDERWVGSAGVSFSLLF